MMRSLRGLIVCEDAELGAKVEEYLREGREVDPVLMLHRYPERREAARHLNLCRPDVVLLAIDRLQPVVQFLRELEFNAPGIPVIGVSRLQDPRALAELLRLGVRDCIATPLNRWKFHDAIHRIAYRYKETVLRAPVDPMVCFVPGRGGSGTSTLACNIAYRMSCSPGAHVLLDVDIAAGLSRFVFNLTPKSSLAELVEHGGLLTVENWRECVVTAGSLHVVHGGRANPRQPFTVDVMRQLIEFAAAHYNTICVDLGGGMETYAVELMRRARTIFLVSGTQEASLQLAREKLQFLLTIELHSRTRVLLTSEPGAPAANVREAEAYLGAPVERVFDFSEKRVMRAITDGALIDPGTSLGREIDRFSKELAHQLAEPPIPVDTLKK